MKINLLNKLSIALVLTAVLLTSCDEETSIVEPSEPATQTGSKEKLREEGIALVESMEKMKESNTIKALETFEALNEDDDTNTPAIAADISNVLVGGVSSYARLSDIATGNVVDPDFPEEEEEEVNFDSLWTATKGTHTYNFQTEEFDKVDGGDVIVVLFPSEENGTVNNVKLTIKEYTSKATSTDAANDVNVKGNLPTAIKAVLEIDAVEEMSYNLSVTYGSDDIPTALNTTLVVKPFSLNFTYGNTGSQVSYSASLKESEKIILSNSISVDGNVSYENLSKIEDEDFESLALKNATFTNQVINTKVAVAVADANKLANDIIDAGDDPTEEAIETILNDNIKVTATFADTNQKIADATIDLFEGDDDDTEIDIILTYADGTKVAIDDFIAEGFEEIEKDLERLFPEEFEDDDATPSQQ